MGAHQGDAYPAAPSKLDSEATTGGRVGPDQAGLNSLGNACPLSWRPVIRPGDFTVAGGIVSRTSVARWDGLPLAAMGSAWNEKRSRRLMVYNDEPVCPEGISTPPGGYRHSVSRAGSRVRSVVPRSDQAIRAEWARATCMHHDRHQGKLVAGGDGVFASDGASWVTGRFRPVGWPSMPLNVLRRSTDRWR